MEPSRRPTRARFALFFALLLLLNACGDDAGDPIAGGPGGDGANPPPPGSTTPPGTNPPPAPPERRELPLAAPSLGGFKLTEAFPAKQVAIPSAMVWPKVAGASPLVLERLGTIREIGPSGERKVLDISSSIALVSEGGALGFALHPDFGDGSGAKPYGYVWYNAKGTPKNKQRLSRFTWSTTSKTFDAASEQILVELTEEKPEHNAGRVVFGPDGFLYFGNGDDIDTRNHQTVDRALFAGIFRIDVDMIGGTVSHAPPKQPEGGATQGYFIPNDNPFVGRAGALEEFYALGLRNPFGFSFDRETKELWAGDVGDTWREEVNLIVKGGNYGWPNREGEIERLAAPITIGTLQNPKHAYSHAEMGDLTAILGGYVYRGKALPELVGKYIYSDWPSARLWALDPATGKRTTLIDNEQRIPMAIAEDNEGEIYLLHFDGAAKLGRAEDTNPKMAKRLSDTTIYADLAALAANTPDAAFVPYEIASPLWSDAAAKTRWISVPAGKKVELGDDGNLKFPVGTRFLKHFEVDGRRLETRVLVVGDPLVWGVSYRWNAEQKDADLVMEPLDEKIPGRTWHYPSFGQCWSCHRADNRVLGFTARQVQKRDELVARGVFDAATVAKLPPSLVKPTDAAASLDARAGAWLAANCSGCHHPGASFLGGGDTWNARADVALAERGLVNVQNHNQPMAEAFGLPWAPLVDPGNPAKSILLARIKSEKADLMMPPLGRSIVDPEGAKLIEQWIAAMPKP